MIRAVCIYNPMSRGAPKPRVIDALRARLHQNGYAAEFVPTERPRHGTELARSAVASGVELVIACGGDGTIHEVATGLAFSPIPLAILPAGTANVLARELDVPRDVMKAADLVPTLKQRRIALGKCGDDYFLLMAGAGLDAAAIQRVTSRSKRHLGRGAFWLAGFRHWCSGCFPQLSVTVDGATYTGTFAVASRVRGYGGRYQITPTAGLFLDRLTVCLFRGGSRTAYLRYLAGVLSKRHVAFHDVLCISGDTVEISSREPVPIQLDGELRGFTPVKLEIVRNALTLLVPRHLPY